MTLELTELEMKDIGSFKRQMQESFQKGAVEGHGPTDILVLPEKDIDESLSAQGSIAYIATDGTQIVGGAIVIIDHSRNRGDLHFLFVDVHHQNRGIGRFIWNAIEARHPNVMLWETHTPYFDQRNIHFYINVCGFHAVEFFNQSHPFPQMSEAIDFERGTDKMFRFEKITKFNTIKNERGISPRWV